MQGTPWETIRPALLSLVGSLTGLQTIWSDQPQPFVSPTTRAIIRLSHGRMITQGRDEIRWDYDAARPMNEEIRDTITGLRTFALTIRCESFEQTDAHVAAEYLEQIRNRLHRRTSTASLNAVGCAVISFSPVVDLPIAVDGRAASVASLDVMLRFAMAEDDPARYGYIATVDATGVFDDVDHPMTFEAD